MFYWKYGCKFLPICAATFPLFNRKIFIWILVHTVQVLVSENYVWNQLFPLFKLNFNLKTVEHLFVLNLQMNLNENWKYFLENSMWHNVTYTPTGMTATLIGQELGCICAILLSSTYLSLYVSSCLYISAFLMDVAKTIKKLDQLVPGLPRTEQKMELKFIEILRLHVKAIQ